MSRELGELLIELSIGVHRYAMYPPGHPSLTHSAAKIGGRVAQCLDSRAVLQVGVARDRLVVDGVATDPRHPVLRDLARTLHDRQVAALEFRAGVANAEIEHLLKELAREAEPDGAAPASVSAIGSGNYITLHPIGYERLTLQDNASDAPTMGRATELWLALAEATMATGAPDTAAAQLRNDGEHRMPDEAALADALSGRSSEPTYEQAIAGYLRQITQELKDDDGPEARVVRDRVSALIRKLDDVALRRMLEVERDPAIAREFVLDANQTLAVDAVVKVLEAAARATGQTVSTSMVRLLAKLAKHAQGDGDARRGRADSALRENIDRLLADWTLEDPNPKEYTQILDAMARIAPPQQTAPPRTGRDVGSGAGATGERESHEHPGAIRLIQMALEVDAWGPTIEAAASELIEAGRVRRLLELVREAPRGCRAAEHVRGYVHDPEHLRRLLSTEEVDEEWFHLLVAEMGVQAVPALLDVLAESESRSVRRRIFDCLVGLGEDLSAEVTPRLDDPRWFVVRNMLALVQRLDLRPAGFDATRFLRHPDARVQKEAFPLAMRNEPGRAEALAFGLASEDERLIHLSLLDVQERELPRPLVSAVVGVAAREDYPPWLRVLAVRALRRETSTTVRDMLLDAAAPASGLFGRRKLRSEMSPVVVAAVEALAERWTFDPAVADVLDAARRSSDADVSRAASTQRRS